MNIPFALYDYIAVFIPGILIMLGVSAAGVLSIKPATSSGVVELVVYITLAFVVGHINQWVGKQVLVALGQFFPILGNMAKYLLTYPYPSSSESEDPGFWRRLWNAIRALSPHPSVLRYGKSKAALIKARVVTYSNRSDVTAGEMHGICLGALQAANSSAVAKREQLTAQADFHRGSFSALMIVALTVWRWGLPPAITDVQVYGPIRLWLALGVAFASLVMLKRYVSRERDAADIVFSTFLSLTATPKPVPGSAVAAGEQLAPQVVPQGVPGHPTRGG